MQVLVIDTHSSPTGVAIVEDEELVGEISIYEEYSQSDHLLPLIQDLFLRTNRKIESIDAFVVCKGPGSFTGLRIGMTTAKTFAQLYEKPVVGISTLEAIGAKCLPAILFPLWTVGEGMCIMPFIAGKTENWFKKEHRIL